MKNLILTVMKIRTIRSSTELTILLKEIQYNLKVWGRDDAVDDFNNFMELYLKKYDKHNA